MTPALLRARPVGRPVAVKVGAGAPVAAIACVNAAPRIESSALPGVVIAGGVACTVTVNDAWPMLPAASLAASPTVVRPSGNVAPEGGLPATVTAPLTASVAVAE